MNKGTGKAARRLAIVGLPLGLLLALVVAWAALAEDAATSRAGGTLVQYQITLADVEGDRWEVAFPDGFEYVGLAAGSEVTVEPEVSKRSGRVVWNGPFPDALEARFWVISMTLADAPPTLRVDGAGVEAVRVEPLARLRLEEEAEAFPDIEAEVTADAEAESTPDEPVEPTPDAGAEATADAEAEPIPDAGAEAGPTPDVEAEVTADAEAEPTPHAGADATATAEPTPDAEAEVTADAEAEPTPDVEAEVTAEAEAANISVSKTVRPAVLGLGEHPWVTYVVTFTNTGAGSAVLDQITDTLPIGLVFGGPAPGDQGGMPDDMVPPDIIWNNRMVPEYGTLALRYYVGPADSTGEYENSVAARMGDELIGPAQASFVVEANTVFFPMVYRNYPERLVAPLPYLEEFSSSALVDWEPFLNYPGLSSGRWYWSGVEGDWGIFNYDSDRVQPENEGYDLFMYNAEGAQEWTDYRIVARMKDVKDHNTLRGVTGIWFRGTYQNSGAMDGRVVGGYYLYMRPGGGDDVRNRLYLHRVDPDDPRFFSQELIDDWFYPPRIARGPWYDVEIVVEGNRIQVWFGRPEDGGLRKAFDWTDPDNAWPRGTVGLATFFTASRWDYIRVYPLD